MAREYIARLETQIRKLNQRERDRYKYGEANIIIDYMKSLEPARLDELANTASEDVLLSMHICMEEFLGKREQSVGPMTCSLPQREMARLLEWLMTFGYNLRCKEIKHEMEMTFQINSSSGMSW